MRLAVVKVPFTDATSGVLNVIILLVKPDPIIHFPSEFAKLVEKKINRTFESL